MKLFKTLLALTITFNSFGQSVDSIQNMMMNPGSNYQELEQAVDNYLNGGGTVDPRIIKSYERHESYYGDYISVDSTVANFYPSFLTTNGDLPTILGCSYPTSGWNALGPKIISTNETIGYNGRLTSLALDLTNDIVYVGSESGGLWKKNIGTNNWINITDHLGFPALGIQDIAINPLDPTEIYCATGYGGYEGTMGYGIGLLHSTDGGQTWERIKFNTSLYEKEALSVQFADFDTSIVYAGIGNDLYKKNGASWTKVFTTTTVHKEREYIRDIRFIKDPNSNVYSTYITTHCVNGCNLAHIYRNVSTNNTWTDIPLLTHHNGDIKRVAIDVSKSTPDLLYASYGVHYKVGGSKYNDIEVVSLTDGSMSWNSLYYDVNQDYYRKIDYNRNDIRISPSDDGVFYMGLAHLQKTTMNSTPPIFWKRKSGIHDDVRDIEIVIRNGVEELWVAHDGGLHRSLDGGDTWILEHENMIIAEYYDVGVSETHTGVMAGALDNLTHLYKDGEWKLVGAKSDGSIAMFFRGDYGHWGLYSENGTVNKYNYNTTTAGSTVHTKDQGSSFWLNAPLVAHPIDDDGALIGQKNVYEYHLSTNSELQLTNFTDQFKISGIAMSHQDENVIYVSRDILWNEHSGYLYKTTDKGANWVDLSANLKVNGQNTLWHGVQITDVTVDPYDDDIVYISFNGIKDNWYKVLKSKDGGQTWIDYSSGLPNTVVHELEMLRGHTDGVLFAGTDLGVYYRDMTGPDAVTTWQCFNKDLPPTIVKNLEVNKCTDELYIATYGKGVHKASLSDFLRPIAHLNTTNQVWSNDSTIYNSIRVGSGVKLTINNATISMAAGTKIIVDQGAELILNSSTITNECGAFWDGIEVWGNSLYNTNSQYCPSGASCLVGKLTMNYSTIENADNAVRLWNPMDWNMRGGMIYASSSFFKNNRRDVEFMAFENHYNSGPNNGQVAPYRSAFYKCDFIIDQNYLFDVKPPRDAMVTLWQVRGIDFDGCDFKNISGQSLNKAGIYSWDADYTVKEWCNQYPCNTPVQSHFIGLKAGIDATSSGMGYAFMVDTTNFINCDYGVVANGVQHAVITRNSFSLDANGFGVQPPSSIGIYLNVADQFTVTQNKLDGLTTGILARSTGGAVNLIDKNGFENAYYGNMAYKDNNDPTADEFGLNYRCNLHQNPGIYDITIHGGTGIARNQGTPTFAADNAFTNSSTLFPEKHIANNSSIGVIMNYFHHTNSAGYILEPTDIDPLKVITHDLQGGINPNDNCLSSIEHFLSQDRGRMDQQKGESERSVFNEAKSNYHQAQYVYTSTVDGGDTYGLLNTVQTTQPQDAWNLRNDLINDSPLSDEVIIETINDGLLSNAILLDVLMVNAHASRNEEIIHLLETKTVPMPAYMINTFLGLFEVLSQRDVLEAEIAHEAIAMNRSARLLIAHWMADSTGDDADSIPALLAEIPTPMADLQRIAYYRGMGNMEQANLIMSAMDDAHELTSWQQDMISGVEDVYNIYDQAVSGGKQQLQELSTTTETTLDNYSQEADTRKGVYAKSWLKFSQEELYLPEMVTYNPPAGKRAQQSVFELREVQEEVIFEIFPNPAQEYITIQSAGYASENVIRIEIINSQGKVVLTNKKMNTTSQNINLGSLPTGMYVIRILDGQHEVQKQMLEIIK